MGRRKDGHTQLHLLVALRCFCAFLPRWSDSDECDNTLAVFWQSSNQHAHFLVSGKGTILSCISWSRCIAFVLFWIPWHSSDGPCCTLVVFWQKSNQHAHFLVSGKKIGPSSISWLRCVAFVLFLPRLSDSDECDCSLCGSWQESNQHAHFLVSGKGTVALDSAGNCAPGFCIFCQPSPPLTEWYSRS